MFQTVPPLHRLMDVSLILCSVPAFAPCVDIDCTWQKPRFRPWTLHAVHLVSYGSRSLLYSSVTCFCRQYVVINPASVLGFTSNNNVA